MHKKMTRQEKVQLAISLRLKQARIAAGYKEPNDFCNKYKLPIINYLEHESGEEPIKLSSALTYCKLLKISLRWLLLGE